MGTTAQPQTYFPAVFASLPAATLRTLAGHFPCDDPPAPQPSDAPTMRVLEAMWRFCLCGGLPDLAPEAWVLAHRPDLTGTYNESYVEEHWMRYMAAGRHLRAQAGTTPVEIDTVFRHGKLPLDFPVAATVGIVNYASLVDHADTPPVYAALEQRVAAIFDTRERRLIVEQVFQDELGGTRTNLNVIEGNSPYYAGELAWHVAETLARGAGVLIRSPSFAFDLEWSSHDPATRYTRGHIVDAHFQEIDTGWIPFHGLIRLPTRARLSPFLQRHNYTLEQLRLNGDHVDVLRSRLVAIDHICEAPLFTAYGGINSDQKVLECARIYLRNYVDATVYLTAGRLVSLTQLYAEEFGESFQAHNAAADTVALLRIIRHRGLSSDRIKAVHRMLVDVGAVTTHSSFPR